MFAKQSMINRLLNPINRNRSAAKISKVLSPSYHPVPSLSSFQQRAGYSNVLYLTKLSLASFLDTGYHLGAQVKPHVTKLASS